uniref:Uncharacterized protein n=1 Tax=Arundo donax TaxID=35708 RepID=A0A0A8YJL6_ARUDO
MYTPTSIMRPNMAIHNASGYLLVGFVLASFVAALRSSTSTTTALPLSLPASSIGEYHQKSIHHRFKTPRRSTKRPVQTGTPPICKGREAGENEG